MARQRRTTKAKPRKVKSAKRKAAHQDNLKIAGLAQYARKRPVGQNAAKVGTAVFSTNFFKTTTAEEPALSLWWWVEVTERMSVEEALKQPWHGPFQSMQEVNEDQR